ncbi:MAG: MBL fold metallo-hydrolase [Acidimicrobiia bacterium]|nr:MBL fold metallo-hydrolase [Acidimicrobiia bacterium]
MIEIVDGIHRLGTSYHNFYVITEGGKATVIDAGCSKEWPKLVAGLGQIGLAPDDVEAIIATHSHADHLGFGREAANAGVTIKVHEAEEARALGRYQGKSAVAVSDLPLLRPGTWKFLIAVLRVGITKRPPLDSVETFTDGETLDLPGSPTVIHTPGHTEGHASFHLAKRGVLFSGDALVTRDILGSRTLRAQMLGDEFHNDPARARESLGRLAGIDAHLILPGHGDPLHTSPADAVRAVRA